MAAWDLNGRNCPLPERAFVWGCSELARPEGWIVGARMQYYVLLERECLLSWPKLGHLVFLMIWSPTSRGEQEGRIGPSADPA